MLYMADTLYEIDGTVIVEADGESDGRVESGRNADRDENREGYSQLKSKAVQGTCVRKRKPKSLFSSIPMLLY